ncbi:MAG: SH3 domain-containing protein [Myxococcales bacterium]|nr:SH3 domain-containing protein [Myxococcales bacterium]
MQPSVLAAVLGCSGVTTPQIVPTAPPPAPAPTDAPPVQAGPPGLTSTNGTTTMWSRGDHPFVGVDGANVRQWPNTTNPVVGRLALGTEVEIREVVPLEVEAAGHTNHWYEITAEQISGGPVHGYVFGSILTPLVHRADLDSDGVDEVLSVTFGPGEVPRVRLIEPELGAQGERTAVLDLSGVGGTLHASLEKVLLRVERCAESGPCEEIRVGYLADPLSPLGTLVTAPLPEPDRSPVTFVPADAPTPVVSGHYANTGDDVLDDADVTCAVIGELQGGGLTGRRVIRCVEVPVARWSEFVERLPRLWTRVDASDGIDAARWVLIEQGYTLTDTSTPIPDLPLPQR